MIQFRSAKQGGRGEKRIEVYKYVNITERELFKIPCIPSTARSFKSEPVLSCCKGLDNLFNSAKRVDNDKLHRVHHSVGGFRG